MFHFTGGDQQPLPGQDMACGDRLAGRIMAAEYSLAVQRGDQQLATEPEPDEYWHPAGHP